MRPEADVAEVTLLGRGVGESLVVHVGDGRWVIVDTFMHDKRPAAQTYLQSIGVDLSAVVCVVVTHLDADHFRGIDLLVDVCTEARLCTTSAVDTEAFAKLSAEDVSGDLVGRMATARRTASRRQPDRYRALGPGQDAYADASCRIVAISPTAAAVQAATAGLSSALSGTPLDQVKTRIKNQNRCSVALHCRIGDATALLGGDVLASPPRFGWAGVLDVPETLHLPKAQLVKAPHHGSSSAHEPRMWVELTHRDGPDTLVAPYTGQVTPIPTVRDIGRLCSLSASVHQAFPSTPRSELEANGIRRVVPGAFGRITARRGMSRSGGPWQVVEHDGPAWRQDCDNPSTMPEGQ